MTTTPIPSYLWSSLQGLLHNEATAFVNKVADVLHISPADLRRAVLSSKDDINVLLYEAESIGSCRAWVQHPGRADFAIHCGNPTIPNEEICIDHKHVRTSVQPNIDNVQVLHRIKTGPDIEPLWLKDGTNSVVNAKGIIVGKINKKNNTLIIFNIEDE
jgi:hypothetical protein